MHHRSSLRRLGSALTLAAVVAACGGAGDGRLADRVSGGSGATAPGGSPTGASPAGDVSEVPASGAPASDSTTTPRPAATQAISTTEASDLLRQVDDLLRQANGELAADGDAAITMGE